MSNVTDFEARRLKKLAEGGPTSAVARIAPEMGVPVPEKLAAPVARPDVTPTPQMTSSDGTTTSVAVGYLDLIDWDEAATNVFSYILNGLHSYISEGGGRPYVQVDTNACHYLGHPFPQHLVDKYAPSGVIVLNLDHAACDYLDIDTDFLTLTCRFDRKSESLVIPVEAVLAIYDQTTAGTPHAEMFIRNYLKVVQADSQEEPEDAN